MEESEYILITGGLEVPRALERALSWALPVRRCPGPESCYCPVVHDEHCPLRAGAKATVVYLAGEHEFFSPGRWECVSATTSPVVAVLEGNSHPPRGRDGFAIVGGATGPIGVLEALAALFDDPGRGLRPERRPEDGSEIAE